MEASAAGSTISVLDAFAAPEVAAIEALPTDLEVASPVGLIVTISDSELPQVTMFVTSRVLRSVKVPIAFSCVVAPSAIDEAEGSIVMLTTAALETFIAAEFSTCPALAITEAAPVESDVAKPVASILATSLLLLIHTTELVASFVEPSSSISIALNCNVCPSAMLEACGVIRNFESCGEGLSIDLCPPHPCNVRLRRARAARRNGLAAHDCLSLTLSMTSDTSQMASTNGLSYRARKTVGEGRGACKSLCSLNNSY
jgi:hypothetical protein